MEKEKTDQNLVENKSNEGKTDQNLVKNQLNGRRMKDSGVEWIGEIPEDWELKRVKHLASFVNGYAFSNDELNLEGVYPVIKIGDIKNESVDLCNANRIMSNEGLEQYKVKNKDILIAMSGATVGKLAFIDYEIEECYINQRVGIIRSNNKFLYYVLNTNEFVEYVILMSNSSAQPNISTGLIGNYPVALPNVNEQQRIADYLDSKCSKIDFIIEKQEAVIEKLQAYKQSLITEAVTKGLNAGVEMKDSGIEWCHKIPIYWKVLRGKVILNLLKQSPDKYNEVVTCFRDGEVTLRSKRREDGFTFSEKEIGYQGIKKGNLVIHGMDGFAGAIGISDSDGKGSPVLVVCDSKENKKYLMYYLRMLATQNVFLAMATGIRERSCDLRWNKIADLSFLVPPLDEQNRIVLYLDSKCSSIDASISKKKLLIEKLKAYKKSLIYEVVTGKKEIN